MARQGAPPFVGALFGVVTRILNGEGPLFENRDSNYRPKVKLPFDL
jgi:hypothetical protein